MAELTESDRQRIREAVAKALEDHQSAPAAAAALTDVPDLKQLFCQNWDKVKKVLLFLKPHLPDDLQRLIDKLIRVGDGVKAAIC